MIKFSNLWKAWLSTALGVGTGILAGLTSAFISGNFDKKAFAAMAIPIVIGGLTDIMSETKKQIDGEQPSK